MSKVINREQCPACAKHGRDNSQDNLSVYDDGHKYCFACEYYEHGNKGEPVVTTQRKNNLDFLSGTVQSIPSRKINEKTARLYGYLTHIKDGKRVELCNYYRDGKVVAQKLRGANKSFQWRGDASKPQLFGQQLWKNKGGKKGNNMLYLSGVQTKKVMTEGMITRVVSEVEKKVSEIENN